MCNKICIRIFGIDGLGLSEFRRPIQVPIPAKTKKSLFKSSCQPLSQVKMIDIRKGVIQIIRDTLGGGGGGTEQCHQITQGGGRGFADVSRDIFSKFLNYIKTVFEVKFPISEQKSIVFLKNENVTSHGGGGGGVRASVTK
jgi:hypothetical protein